MFAVAAAAGSSASLDAVMNTTFRGFPIEAAIMLTKSSSFRIERMNKQANLQKTGANKRNEQEHCFLLLLWSATKGGPNAIA